MLGLNRQIDIEIWMDGLGRVRQRGAWSIRKELPAVDRITESASSSLQPVAASAWAVWTRYSRR